MRLSDFVSHKKIEAKLARLPQAEAAYADILELVLHYEQELLEYSKQFEDPNELREFYENPGLDNDLWKLPQSLKETVPST